MSNTAWLLVSLALLALVIAAVFLWRRRAAGPTPQTTADPAIIHSDVEQTSDGTTVAVPRKEQTRFQRRVQAVNNSPAGPWLLALATVVVLALGYWVYESMYGVSRSDEFVVLVAPFRDTGGDVSQTGRAVAQELALALAEQRATNDRYLVVETVGDAPINGEDAYQTAKRNDADVLIWGEVSPGGVLDQQSLLPQIAYAPTGRYAPNVWEGYVGRFTMPGNFAIATSPINGRVILPPLVSALADYSNGDADITFDVFGQLASNYPALAPALLHSFRGNILWARGAFEQAADEYQLALASSVDDMARLQNNLSAIYLDGNDGRLLNAMEQALQNLQETQSDMGELRFNLALLALSQGRAEDAVNGLQAAQDGLLPKSTPLLVTLARAQREAGQFDAAAATLDSAQQQSGADMASVPRAFSSVLREQQRATILEEQGLLALARLAGGSGPLAWELEAMPAQPREALQPARTALESSLASTSSVVDSWRSSETTDAARNRPGQSLIDNGQARRAERANDTRQTLVAMARLEEAREELSRDTGFFRGLFGNLLSGSASISGVASTLRARIDTEPDNIDLALLYGRVLRLRRDFEGANAQYDNVIARAPLRPEALYGKGMIALDQGDVQGAKAQLSQSLDRNQAFFPARQALARIAIDAKDWPAAIAQLTWLADNRGQTNDKIALAQALRQSGKDGYAQSFQILQPLADANNADALVELGRLYNDSGNHEAALNAYQDAVKANPRSGPALFELGETLAAQGNYQEAEQRMLMAIDIDPANIDARLALAELYIGPLNRPDAAADLYSSLLEQGVGDVTTLTKMGDELLARRRADEAVSAYLKAVERKPDDPWLHHKLALAYAANNNLDGARQSEQKALDLAGGTFPEALAGLGDVARQSGNLDQAFNYYNQALSQNGNLVAARIGLGQTVASQGNWSGALVQFQDAANLEPQNPMAHFWMGEAQLRQGDRQGAITSYNQTIALQPEFPEALLGLAQAQLDADPDRANGLNTAMETLNKALEIRPRYGEALLLKGKILQEQSAFLADDNAARSKMDEALRVYSDAISANGDLSEPYYRRGLIQLQRSNYGDAENDFQSAIERQGNFAESHYWLGRTYYAQSRLEAALSEFKTAVNLQGGTYAEARLYQGLVEEQIGDRNAATTSFQSVIQIDSNSEWATKARQELEQLQD